VDPFAVIEGRLGSHKVTPRDAEPFVRVQSPDGTPVWIVTRDELARQVVADPRISKDTAFAPSTWRSSNEMGLEPTAAEKPSLTTLEGSAHVRLRRAHAPLFTGRRIRAQAGQITALARSMLAEVATGAEPVDLTADFTSRFPLTVICDLLGVPRELQPAAHVACKTLLSGSQDGVTVGIAALDEIVAAALGPGQENLSTELRSRMPAGIAPEQVPYLLTGLIIAGQVTTEASLGFMIAYLLDGHLAQDADDDAVDRFVHDVLRHHPPAPYSLWRFTTTEVEIAGTVLPPRTPILIDIEGINHSAADQEMTFGAGAHYCIGAQLAALELRAVAQVMRSDFPQAHLAMPFGDLPLFYLATTGRSLMSLPVWMHRS
jgi:cytochrome P450